MEWRLDFLLLLLLFDGEEKEYIIFVFAAKDMNRKG